MAWQTLPRQFRRKLFFRSVELIAPRPDQRPPTAQEPFYVVGPLRTASGLGQWARLSLEALRTAGYDAWGIDISLAHDPKRQEFSFAEAGDATGPGTILLHANGFMTAFAMRALGRRRVAGKTIIGYWAWELPDLPEEWLSGFRFVHEVWACSRFTGDAIRRRTDLPVRVLLPPLSSAATGSTPAYPYPPLADGCRRANAEPARIALTVFDMASSFERKNPLAAIEAFSRAFDESWRLIIKVSDADAYPAGLAMLREAAARHGNVTVIDEILSREAMAELMGNASIILSLHRSEGIGLVMAEAMLAGKVAVATNWSGNTDFMSAENSCPVAYHLVPAHDPQGTYDHPEMVWAEPDIEDAARQLRRLKDAETRARLGTRAARDSADLFSPRRYAENVARYLGVRRGSEKLPQDLGMS